MVIKFAFCAVSLLWTSRYVLICCTRLMHFLCCNLFVIFCLTLSAISANVLEIRLPITSIYPFTDGQFHNKILCYRLRQRFSRMFSKLAWATLRYYFYEVCYPFFFSNFMGYRMEVGGYFSEFCESSQNSRSRLPYTAPLVS